jgi:diguanylate cyclase (GGDEF)-like protein/PAS domain S-box-containing protein
MNRETETQRSLNRYSSILLAFVIFINIMAVTGWLTHKPILASLRSEYIPMPPATALVFLVFCGVWLIQKRFAYRSNIRIFVRLILVGMYLLVLLLAIRYFTGLGPDLEQILSPNPPLFGQILSARMSPLTAFGFLLAIPAFLLLTGLEPGKHVINTSAILSFIVFIINGIFYLGYLFRAPLFYGGTFIPISLTSVLAFLFLSLALMLKAGQTSWPVSMFLGTSIKARLMRVFLPVSFIIVLFQGLLSEVFNPWNINPAYRVAVAAVLACIFSILIITYLAHSIGAEIDRGDRARLEAEKTLAISEERFRLLFEHAAIGVALIDTTTGHYIDINQRYCDFLGYTKEEMLKQSFQDVTDPDYVQENIDKNALLLEGKIREFTIEKRYIQKSGEKVWGELTVSPLWKPGEIQSTFAHIAVVQDITARKKAEDALGKSEERFKKLFDEAPLGISLNDSLTGQTYAVNAKFANIMGRTVDEVLTNDWMSFTYPEDLQQDLDNMVLLNAGKIPGFQMEKRYIRPDGSLVWIKMTVAPIDIEGTEHPHHLCMVEEITERKRFELVQNATYRITEAAITSDGIDTLYESIHSILRELISAENLFIALYDSNNGLISFPYYIDQYDQKPTAPTVSQGLTGYVIRSGRPLLATPQIYDQLIQQGEVEAIGTKSVDWLGVPLKSDGRIIGVIVLQSYTQETHYTQKDLELLEFVSTQIAQVIERTRLEEEIRNLSLTDDLTGLNNRRGFTHLAEQELRLAHRNKRSMLLFFCDVDHLKLINDTFGHAQGDIALKEISSILKECFREADIMARIGGDEFVVLTLDDSRESADALTRRIEAALIGCNQQPDRSYQLTLSLGVAHYDPASPTTLDELLATADSQMYLQKQSRHANNPN